MNIEPTDIQRYDEAINGPDILDDPAEDDAANLQADADRDDPPEDNMTDVEADADTLASAGMGTDEDYGCFSDGGDS